MSDKRNFRTNQRFGISAMHSTRYSKRTKKNVKEKTDEPSSIAQGADFGWDGDSSDSDDEYSLKSPKFYEREASTDSSFPSSHSLISKLGDIEENLSSKRVLTLDDGEPPQIPSSDKAEMDSKIPSPEFRVGETVSGHAAESGSISLSINDKVTDDILIQILARTPGSSAGPLWKPLQQVCRRWRRLVQGPQFIFTRLNLRSSESWLVTLTCRFGGGLLCKLFDPVSQRCQKMNCSWTVLPPSRKYFSFTSVDHEIYVIGGLYQRSRVKSSNSNVGQGENYDGNTLTVTDSCDVFDPFHDISRKIAPLTFPRSHMACCSGNGKIYIMGGLDKDGNETTVAEVYHPDSNQWTRIADLPEPRHNCIAEFVNGKVYLLKGRYKSLEDLEHLLSVRVYDPETDAWQAVASLPIGGPDFKTCVMHGRLCVIGGLLQHIPPAGNSSARCFNLPLVLDEEENEWKVWRHGSAPLSLRSLHGGGTWQRLRCHHRACLDYQSRPFAVVVLNDEMYLIRRCIDAYCRHIHRFRAELALAGDNLAWECILRKTKFSNLLREAGDCWHHSVAVAIRA